MQSDIKKYLIVGLGNPGQEYACTRHNAGFRVLDLLSEEMRANYWKMLCGAQVAQGSYKGHFVALAKPQSFMNASGGPVKKLLSAFEMQPENLIVIHDDMDIEPASVRVKFGGGSAGHNGLKSLVEKLQSSDWLRVRVGIGRPPGKMDSMRWVLASPKGSYADDFEFALGRAALATCSLIDEGLEKTQNIFNARPER